MSARLIAFFSENGYTLTKNEQEADVIVINTCGFISLTQKLSISLIDDTFKRCHPKAKILAVGCLVQIDRQKLEKRFPNLCLVERLEQLDILNETKTPFSEISCFHYDRSLFSRINYRNFYIEEYLVRVLCRLFKTFKRFPFSQILEEEFDENKIFIQIGSGCLNQCRYCVIKKARGDAISRPISDIVEEIKRTYRQGIAINLVADDCGSYGLERGDDLLKLLYKINEECPGVPLELSYLHPRWLEQYENRYLEAFRDLNIRNINVSLQSGSDRILASMGRGYSVNTTVRILAAIKKISPVTMIWGYFLFGYPTEKWRDFYLTLKATRYYDLFYIFLYSPVSADGPNGNHRRTSYTNTLKKIFLKLNLHYRLLSNALR